MNTAPPPGPTIRQIIRCFPRLQHDLLGCMMEWKEQYGDVVKPPLHWPPAYHLSHPDDIRYVLSTNAQNYRKTGALILGKRLFGDGLLTSEEPLHTRQRRIVQRSFQHEKLSAFVRVIADATEEMLAGWEDATIVEITHAMNLLTMGIIGRAILGDDLRNDAGRVRDAFAVCQNYLQGTQIHLVPESIPTPKNLRFRAAVREIDEVVLRLIRERRNAPDHRDDLLTALTASVTVPPLPEQQIRDEVVTVMLAGHETTALLLSWTFFLLSQHPPILDAVVREVTEVLGSREPVFGDLKSLRYTGMVVSESLRLYPPVWILARKASAGDRLPCGVEIPAEAEILMSSFIVHHDSRFFPDPNKFDPLRFTATSVEQRPQFAYFPFGGGPRGCIGEQFARLEATIILAMIVRRVHLSLVPGQKIVPLPLITLRPRYGIRMRITHREK